MKIDIKEIIDYCRCPMLYKFRYKSPEFKTSVINILEKYDQDIHKTIYAFFSTVQCQELVSLVGLKRIWGSLWIGAKTPTDILYVEPSSWRDTHNERRKRGINTIINIFNRFNENPGFPIVVNKEYSVEINKNLTLTGTWEVIREIEEKGNKVIELMDFKVDDKLHNKIHIDKDLEVTAASYAFRRVFGVQEDRILYYGLDKNKLHLTSRGEEDYKMLEHTVKCVSTAIHNNLFYACPDDKCYSCPYKSVCVNSLNIENMK